MIKKVEELTTKTISKIDDIGNFTFTPFFSQDEIPKGMNEMGILRIAPGEECGIHSHFGESDTYYILSGIGQYVDNEGNVFIVKTGDVTCCYDGEKHALLNRGNEELVAVAIIPKTN
jgi:mannose-6-phosphate isomerase-like protein (cupin superfamily)